jgi:hypothetical protein
MNNELSAFGGQLLAFNKQVVVDTLANPFQPIAVC